ncbi:MAG: hypothetical protein PHX80_04780 [Candidatus Nanoarchaeia archaeon]|nr:hypothetical protein [Candidatus Nanoarchaeia archaeon]
MSKAEYYEKYGFVTLTNEAITISGAEGWKYVSIKNSSSSTGNVTFTSTYSGSVGGKVNGNIVIVPGEKNTLGTGENAVDGVTITVPAGTTAYVECVKMINTPIGS